MSAPDLPAALRPWRTRLSIFPRDLALSLGPLVQRVAALVGNLPAQRQHNLGDPNGLDGITRRGPMERLVLSQWALAQEVPDEFLRRAAHQELQFLALARQQPVGVRRSLVLLDAGPLQMGAPRLVQLAALVVLAARAQVAGVPFSLGVLQHPDAGVFDDVTEGAIKQVLKARGSGTATAEHASAWEAQHGAPEHGDDMWVLGPWAPPAWPHASRLWAEEVLELGARGLDVSAVHAGKVRTARVEIPSDDVGVRLLRDPFGWAVPVRPTVREEHRPRSNAVFSHQGHWMFTRGGPGEVVGWPVPNSPKAAPGKPRVFRAPHAEAAVLAVGLEGRTVTVLTEHGGLLHLTHFGLGNGGVKASVQLQRHPGLGRWNHGPLVALHPAPGAPQHVLVHDPDAGCVWKVQVQGTGMEKAHVFVAALETVRGILVLADMRGAMSAQHPTEVLRWTVDVPARTSGIPVHLGHATKWSGLGGVVWAWNKGGRSHLIVARGVERALTLPKGMGMLGVGEFEADGDAHFGLLVLEDDKRTLVALGIRQTKVLARLPAPLWRCTVGAARPVMACITTQGHVVMVSTRHGQILMQTDALGAPQEGLS